MSDKKKPDLNEILGLMVMTAAFATLTYPILQLTGIHDFLAKLSVDCAKGLFQFFGIQP